MVSVLFEFFIVILCLTVLFFVSTFICFYLTFYVKTKDKIPPKYSLPLGNAYNPFKEKMVSLMKETENIPFKECVTKSFDGLSLYGKYYEYKKGAPIELMHHGYRGYCDRDLCGGVLRCFNLKRNCLLIDLRASGKSGGNVITFGINESKDTLSWIDYIINNIDKDAEIILTGISMGASTVLMAGGENLPKNVTHIVADSGYTSAKEIIKKVIKQIHLPSSLVYPIIKLSAKIYGGFNLEENSPIKAIEKCKIPIIFFHGEDDGFVPCEMSKTHFNAYKNKKAILTVKGADHGLCYLVDKEGYLKTIREFEKK